MDTEDRSIDVGGLEWQLIDGNDPRLAHFDDATYGADEDTHRFRKSVRDALAPLKGMIDDCEEIWSPVGQGIGYIRAMSIVVQEVNKVSSNAVGRILVYSGQPHFAEDVGEGQ